jgi:leucyl/phenylalanyl-tRNA--protein transferase
VTAEIAEFFVTDAQSLTPENLVAAYTQGFFPMPSEHDSNLIQWLKPNPRAIIPLQCFHLSRSMRREIRRRDLVTRRNSAFVEVMIHCAQRSETWISADILRAYTKLHQLGLAHSIEIYCGDLLVGGVYGVALGSAFFAESMFHTESNMSKLALFRLVERLKEQDFLLLECQFLTSHLSSLGAVEISDEEYQERLESALNKNSQF